MKSSRQFEPLSEKHTLNLEHKVFTRMIRWIVQTALTAFSLASGIAPGPFLCQIRQPSGQVQKLGFDRFGVGCWWVLSPIFCRKRKVKIKILYLSCTKILKTKKSLDFSLDKFLISMVPPARLERTTPRLGIWCSIHLSYGGMMIMGFISIST